MSKKIAVTKLIVNPENFRFDPVKNQDEAIDLMLKEKGSEILVLAEHIVTHGLDQAKSLRVIKSGDSFLLLDGNRRTTAIKCLENPKIITDQNLKHNFQKLHNSFKKNPVKEVSCLEYPDEETASLWIGLDHTGKNSGAGQDAWDHIPKQRFDNKFKNKKLSPALQAMALLEENKIQIDTKALNITTVDRILSSQKVRPFLGIKIVDGNLQISSNKADSLERLKTLFEKMIREKTKVRSVYNKTQIEEFISNLFKDQLVETLENSTEQTDHSLENEDDLGEDLFGKKITKPLQSSYKKTTIKIPKTLISRSSVPKVSSKKIKEICKELSLIEVETCATAVSALVRILADISAKELLSLKGFKFDSQGHLLVIGQQNKKTLKEKLDYITNQYCSEVEIKKAMSALNKDIFTGQLNEVMHNTLFSADQKEIRNLWGNFEKIFNFIISEIQAEETKK